MDWDVIFPKPQQSGSGDIKVACIGDSITYGAGVPVRRDTDAYPAVLSQLLGERYRVINFGACNRTASDLYPFSIRLTGFIGKAARMKPNAAIVFLGTNDCKPSVWKRGRFCRDYEAIVVRLLRANPGVRLFVVCPPMVYDDACRSNDVFDKDMRRQLITIAAARQAEIVDLFELLKGRKELFADGLHPNAEGNRVIAQILYERIKELGL